MMRSALSSVLICLLTPVSAFAEPQCEKGFQPRGEVCIHQAMADYLACIEAAGGNKLELDHQVDSAIADAAKGSVSGQAKGIIVSGSGTATLTKDAENAISDHLQETFESGSMKTCADVLKSFDKPDNRNIQQNYNWRKDAERLSNIYNGSAYCEKYNKTADSNCINTSVGNYRQNDKTRSYSNVLTITARTLSVHTTEYDKSGVLDRDINASADISDLSALSDLESGGYYDGTIEDQLELRCISGECVRWSGWQFVSSRPGEAHKEFYDNKPVIDSIDVPVVNNIDKALIFEMRRIFARLISDEHTDKGEIACELICHNSTCSGKDNCDDELDKPHNNPG